VSIVASSCFLFLIAGFALYTMLFEDLVKDERSKIPFSVYLDNDRCVQY